MVEDSVDLSPKGGAKANESIVLSNEAVNKASELSAKGIPKYDLYDYIS